MKLGGDFFGPVIIQLGVAAWGVLAIFLFRDLVRYSELRPAGVKYLVCGVAAVFGAAIALVLCCMLFLAAPWVAVLLLPVLLIWAVFAIWRSLGPPPS